MEDMIEKIYFGEYDSIRRDGRKNRAEELLCRRASGLEDEFMAALPEALREKYIGLRAAQAEYQREYAKEEFCAGFRLGIRLMVESVR